MQSPPESTADVRILVVDDHTLFRRGLVALLARDPRHKVVGDAADASQAQRRAQELQPDLILLDNHLGGVNGVDAVPALREAAPKARVLMLTVSEDENDLATALRNGASGYLLKTMEGDALTHAINRAMAGESVIAPEMTPLATLTPRELDILRAITAGASNKEIARQLAIAETTVKIHVQHILRKLDVTSRVHAAVLATENGLLDGGTS